jgi:sugar/nucleoside kinase (ribokinase family)
VSATSPDPPPVGAPTLCLGDPRIDLICERPLDDISCADAFVPHPGGAVAIAAVVAARLGARVALAGGAGDDAWGGWLRGRLGREGLELSRFELVPGMRTPLALLAVSSVGEPRGQEYGDNIAVGVGWLAERLEEDVRGSAALFIGADTLIGSEDREVTMRARNLALSLGRPAVFAPGLALQRWRSRAEAAAAANACVRRAARPRKRWGGGADDRRGSRSSGGP